MWRLWGLCKVRGKPENWHSSPGLLLQPERPSLLPRAPSVLLSRRILLSLWLSLRYTPPQTSPHPTRLPRSPLSCWPRSWSSTRGYVGSSLRGSSSSSGSCVCCVPSCLSAPRSCRPPVRWDTTTCLCCHFKVVFFLPPAVYLLLRFLSSLMRESLKKFLTSQLFPPSVSCCYGVAACGCFVSTYQPGYREAEAGSSRAYVSAPIINVNQARNWILQPTR